MTCPPPPRACSDSDAASRLRASQSPSRHMSSVNSYMSSTPAHRSACAAGKRAGKRPCTRPTLGHIWGQTPCCCCCRHRALVPASGSRLPRTQGSSGVLTKQTSRGNRGTPACNSDSGCMSPLSLLSMCNRAQSHHHAGGPLAHIAWPPAVSDYTKQADVEPQLALLVSTAHECLTCTFAARLRSWIWGPRSELTPITGTSGAMDVLRTSRPQSCFRRCNCYIKIL